MYRHEQESEGVMRSESRGCDGARQWRRDVLGQHSEAIVFLPPMREPHFALETLLCTVSLTSTRPRSPLLLASSSGGLQSSTIILSSNHMSYSAVKVQGSKTLFEWCTRKLSANGGYSTDEWRIGSKSTLHDMDY